MRWRLSAKETAGVFAVGLAMSYVAVRWRWFAVRPMPPTLAGAVLYTLGVVIGANRPPRGWLGGS